MAIERFSVAKWLKEGAAALDLESIRDKRPLSFDGVSGLERGPLEQLVSAMGVKSPVELLDWVEPEELPPLLQEQLASASEGQFADEVAEPVAEDTEAAHVLDPVSLVEGAISEYRDHLVTEFRARDPQLREALFEALDQPRFLAQEAFFQAHRPFKHGKEWGDLGIDPRLARTMRARSGSNTAYLHQSQALDNLLSDEPRPMVVTTGTGSGKTECFLLPIIQNAIEDAARFRKAGLTALIIYPMNALANDQEIRIKEYLRQSGHSYVTVARYDRTTPEAVRARLRERPPQILLTNYMMLEYLLVRPADREELFANHRCRYVVLDEVHTYRGTLGANIGLLFRRLRTHLEQARHDWAAADRQDVRRFPKLIPVATSATIKSVDEAEGATEDVRKLREVAVQEFLSTITGLNGDDFQVLGEELQGLQVPAEVRWPARPIVQAPPTFGDPEAARRGVAALADLPPDTPIETSCRAAGILWFLAETLAKKPLSVAQLVEHIRATVPARADASDDAIRAEVELAIAVGAAMPPGTLGALRLRTHRLVRGGWRFHRCVDPGCGKLYPMGQDECSCGHKAAPLYLCRACGADALRFRTEGTEPDQEPLEPNSARSSDGEWLLYDRQRLSLMADDGGQVVAQMRQRPVVSGTYDPATSSFSQGGDYGVQVTLAPARNRCLVCGASAGRGSVLTPVALGTSSAVRVIAEGLVEGLTEQNAKKPGHDNKERLLIFADSRQDAAHQSRFISYAGRYDRMRRNLVAALREASGPLSMEEALTELVTRGVKGKDNPHTAKYADADYLPKAVTKKARVWEEAPLLDDISVSARYRATIVNLGLVGIRYDPLDRYVEDRGEELASRLGISKPQLFHLARCTLDEMRTRNAVARMLLQYHPLNPHCPDEFRAADWERRFAWPNGYVCDDDGEPVGSRASTDYPDGLRSNNVWRSARGRAPNLERCFRHLLDRFGGIDPDEPDLLALMHFLLQPGLLVSARLHGKRKAAPLLQVNSEALLFELVGPEQNRKCTVCNVKMAWAEPGAPCPSCRGTLEVWADDEIRDSRYVRRILHENRYPLVAGEHTAQITSETRMELEEQFKGPPERSHLNVLSCSPTLEMGIDVGGLDAVIMRNVPPRPDNYAQRGGRAGRRSRVGVVVSYARHRPHDAYFYDKPSEMIAGEVPAPVIGLRNRDVVLRHLNAIAFGLADPGLHGRMVEYISMAGELRQEVVDELLDGLRHVLRPAAQRALAAWGRTLLEPLGLDGEDKLHAELKKLPGRVQSLFERVQFQVLQLQETIQQWAQMGQGDWRATNAQELKRRILGVPSERRGIRAEADDRSGGHPMRRFAEFGILPGYEFPSEPATVRLMGDSHEEEPISVARRFGLAQYQPDAPVHARGHRWKVIGLDTASPWNPRTEDPGWIYATCDQCGLSYGAQQHGRCPRCGQPQSVEQPAPCYEFGGFLARREDMPVLEEEDRFAIASRVKCFPQWSGDVLARYEVPGNWRMHVRQEEPVRWLNEGGPATQAEQARGAPALTEHARGFYICPSCGRVLKFPDPEQERRGGRRRARRRTDDDPYGHASNCARRGEAPVPLAIGTETKATTMRIVVELPLDVDLDDFRRWGMSLGFSLRTGMRQLYMLDGPEIEFLLEEPWEVNDHNGHRKRGSLTFIDGAVGGSGFLERAAKNLNLVAKRALDHLDHQECESACYRCLKTYRNQRFHEHLSWPRVLTDLHLLASQAPSPLPLERTDITDPKPWLDAYAAGVGSPLELRFLRLFEEHNLPVDKQVPVAAETGGQPISTADFVLSGHSVAIYVDGAAFHTGRNLRRDARIRERLREGSAGWKVVVLGARDLSRGDAVAEEIRRASEIG